MPNRQPWGLFNYSWGSAACGNRPSSNNPDSRVTSLTPCLVLNSRFPLGSTQMSFAFGHRRTVPPSLSGPLKRLCLGCGRCRRIDVSARWPAPRRGPRRAVTSRSCDRTSSGPRGSRLKGVRGSSDGSGHQGPNEVARLSPPPVEGLAVIMHAQRAPIAPAGTLPQKGVDNHAPGVEAKPHAQRFECALFPAPKQGEKPEAVRRGRLRQELLFLGGEVIGGEGVTARLDDFEIAAQCRLGPGDGASRPTRAVADRDSYGRGSISDEDLRSAARGRANFYARQGPGIGRQVQAGGQRALRRPAPKPPVRAALWESHAAQADR